MLLTELMSVSGSAWKHLPDGCSCHGCQYMSACCCGVPVSQLHAAIVPVIRAACTLWWDMLSCPQVCGKCCAHTKLTACCLVWQGGDLMEAIAKDTKGDLRWDRNGASLAIDVVRGLCHLHSKNVVSAQLLADVACHGAPSGAQRDVCI